MPAGPIPKETRSETRGGELRGRTLGSQGGGGGGSDGDTLAHGRAGTHVPSFSGKPAGYSPPGTGNRKPMPTPC